LESFYFFYLGEGERREQVLAGIQDILFSIKNLLFQIYKVIYDDVRYCEEDGPVH